VLKHSTQSAKDFDSVLDIYKNAATADEKIAALSCIGASNDMEVCKRVLNEMVLDSELVRLQDTMYPVASLVSDCPHKEQMLEIVWLWVTSNWTILHKKLAGTISLLGRILQFSISQNIGEDFALKVEAWASGKDCVDEKAREERVKQVKDAKRPLEQALEAVRGNTKWYEREKDVSAWLAAKA
jgi:aminopeptidase 2